MLNKPDFIDEEQNYLLNSLLTLTQKNPAIWECVEYNPLSFLSSEEDDGTISACIRSSATPIRLGLKKNRKPWNV